MNLPIFGLSALAGEAYGFTLVRASMRHTIPGDLRIRFCYILMSLKKCSKWIFEKNFIAPRGGFGPKTPFLAEKWPFEPISSKPRIRF